MRRRRALVTASATCVVAAGALYALTGGPRATADQARTFKEIRWDALIPKDWDPIKRFQNSNRGVMDDSDPYAQAPVKGIRTMDTVWVSGLLATTRRESSMGMSGYDLKAVAVSLSPHR